MKKIVLVAFVFLTFASCKKEAALTKSYGCISQSQELAHLSAADSLTVYGLFKANNLSTDSLAFYDYDPFYQLNNELVYDYHQNVAATQIKNGLPVFFGDVTVQFGDGYSNGITGKYDFIIKLSNKPTFQYPQLRQSFLDEGINNQGIAASYKDSCFTAQFGYFNLSKITQSATPDFTTAWKVHPTGSQYPVCYFRDDNGKVIYFQVAER